MKLYITGATGFVGRAVVAEARRRGHDVIAVVRPGRAGVTSPPSGGARETDGAEAAGDSGGLSEARVDLRSSAGLADGLTGVDSVIHLAAAKSGDFHTQFAGTVVATENLLAAMTEAGVKDLVAISTFSVYDYLAMKPGTVVDEESPVDTSPELRDEYARTKLIQEDLYRRHGAAGGNVVILRPGMIYGPDNLWHALLGAELGPRFLRIGSRATLPLTYVENCADAIVDAAEGLTERPGDLAGQVINIVDDNLPTQQAYAELVARRVPTPPTISVPWPVMNAASTALKAFNQSVLGGRAKFPGIAVPDRLHARFKPLRYTNDKAKRLLGWSPRYSLIQSIDRSVAAENTTAIGFSQAADVGHAGGHSQPEFDGEEAGRSEPTS